MSNRANARAACKSLLDQYKTTHTDSTQPEYLAHVYDHPPPRVTGRSAWVNKGVSEALGFGANVLQRVMQPSITVVNKLASSDDMVDEQDAIVDALITLVTTASVQTTIRAITSTPLLPANVSEEEISADDGTYAGFRLTFNLPVQTGYNI